MYIKHFGTVQFWDDKIKLKYFTLLAVELEENVVMSFIVYHVKGKLPSTYQMVNTTAGFEKDYEWCRVREEAIEVLKGAMEAWKACRYKRSIIPASFFIGYCNGRGLDLHAEGIVEL